ncbi:sensory neuron membrane protein 1-like [Cimex lectularius]|uniref:Sensory neuron membrane protein 1 n=1 Tax=Cimex lectularius TaxID=79782 RepID=A0A8I6RTC5_CIMLE|nr:sensory neuron membrane protein 1-like [Cimex lectularius]
MKAPMKLGVAGVIVFLVGTVVGFWGFYKFLYYKIGQSVALSKDSEMRKTWSKMPLALEFKVHIFNVTNPDEAHDGAKPNVKEIGPYFFEEWKEKVNLEDDNTDDTVSFNMKAKWIFRPDLSGGLTGEEVVFIPHPALLSMVLTAEKEKPGALPMLAKALPPLFNFPSTVFVPVKAMDILFRGIPINCTSTEFGPKAVCTMIRQNPRGMIPDGKNIFLFSFFGAKNNTPEAGRFTVHRGVRNPKEVGMMVKFNGKTEQNVWSGPECNALKGTDSTIFPPFLSKDEEALSFAPDLCRSIGARYQHPTVYKGIPGNFYTATLGDMSANEDEKCFCPSPTTCLKKGAFDIYKCAGAPIILTLPHFYEADPSYLDEIDGLHPQAEKHQIFINFEPITGTPLGARKRLQFNIGIHAIKKVPLMKSLPTALVPMFWVEEGLELNQDFIDILDANLFRTLRIIGVAKWVITILGLILIGAGVLLHFYRQKGSAEENTKNVNVSSVTPKKY